MWEGPPGPFTSLRLPPLPFPCSDIGFIVYGIGKPLDPFLQRQYS